MNTLQAMKDALNICREYANEHGYGFNATENLRAAIEEVDKFAKFVEQISRLSIWDYDDYQECEYPAEGYLESHCCLMELVEVARKLIPYRSKE